MKKSTFWLIILILFAVIIGFWIITKKSDKKPDGKMKGERQPLKVDAMVVRPSVLIEEISVSGSLLANNEVELKNEVAGRIVMVNLPEGKFVKEGTLLVKLYDVDLQANLKKLQTQLAIQEQIHQRQSELLKVNGISQNDYDQTGLVLNELQADIEIQKALIRKTEVLAPFDGIIGLRKISVGAEITPSTLLATIRSNDRLKLDFSVPEKYGQKIKPGKAVLFTLYDQKTTYNATVFATEQGIDETTRNLKVRAFVENPSSDLLSGAYANVILQLGENNQALVVPSRAIIPREKGKVLIVAKNGIASFVPVKTGIRKESVVEITDGIQAGDTVITSGILSLKEGSKLAFSKILTDSL